VTSRNTAKAIQDHLSCRVGLWDLRSDWAKVAARQVRSTAGTSGVRKWTGRLINSDASCPSKPTEQDQYQEDDDHKAKSAAAIVAGPVKRPPSNATEASEQDDDQYD
jgi:hypothetical protein